MARIKVEEVREGLEIKSERILYKGIILGRIVRYGAKSGRLRGNFSSRTEFASRIYGQGLSIEETGSKPYVVLDRVARKLAKAINDGLFRPTVVPSAESNPPPEEPHRGP